MFDAYLDQVKAMLNAEDVKSKARVHTFNESKTWPRTERQIILNHETAIELGHPSMESLSFLLWTESADKINDNNITIIGPDLNQINAERIPYGKIVLVKTHGFDEDNAYKRFEKMDRLKFTELEGFMLRSVPQDYKEWSRVSKKALKSGFSLRVIGNELIRDLKKLDFVEEAEVIFITSSKEDVERFKLIAETTGKAIQAMNKMFVDLEYDCEHCGFKDVCNEIEGMKEMHQKVMAG